MKRIKIGLVLAVLALQACGTDTGNPGFRNSVPNSATSSLTDQISISICSKVKSCFSPVLADCELKIRTVAQVPSALGLNEAVYPNFDSIEQAIDAQILTVDGPRRDSCFQSLQQVSCSDSAVQQAYSSTDVENLSQIWKILGIDSNCSQFIY